MTFAIWTPPSNCLSFVKPKRLIKRVYPNGKTIFKPDGLFSKFVNGYFCCLDVCHSRRNSFRYRKKIARLQQRYTYRVLQTIQMKLILLCVWAEQAILGSTKALSFWSVELHTRLLFHQLLITKTTAEQLSSQWKLIQKKPHMKPCGKLHWPER